VNEAWTALATSRGADLEVWAGMSFFNVHLEDDEGGLSPRCLVTLVSGLSMWAVLRMYSLVPILLLDGILPLRIQVSLKFTNNIT